MKCKRLLPIVLAALLSSPVYIPSNEVKAVTAADSTIGVQYQAHVQNIGWQIPVKDGSEAGTDGRAYRVEALKINLLNAPSNAHIVYQTHVQNIGWQNSVTDGTEAGTDGKSLRIEALKLSLQNLPGYSIRYKVHVQNIGWMNWVSDGQVAGTEGKSLRVEAIEIELIKISDNTTIGVQYQGHVQNIGWQDPVQNGNIAGTEGKALRVEALKINLINAPEEAKINYQAHVQNIGWQGVSSDNMEMGTHGKGYRVEAVKISLENLPGYSVQYRVHIQNIGWSDWASDGKMAGTVGQSLRIEGIEIRIVKTSSTPTPEAFEAVTKPVSVSAISLNKTKDTIYAGSTDTLLATIIPSDASNENITWTTSNDKIATVNNKGKVTAVSAGTATITASTVDGNHTANCIVTVSNASVQSISLNKNTDLIVIGSTDTLIAVTNPSYASNKNITWTSSDDKIATVDNAGKVTAVALGTTTITAASADGNYTDFCTVTVESLKIKSIDDINKDVYEYDSYSLPDSIEVNMNNGTKESKPVLWSSNLVDTSKTGTVTYEGTVDGYDSKVKLNLNVKSIESDLRCTNLYTSASNNGVKYGIALTSYIPKDINVDKVELYSNGTVLRSFSKEDLTSGGVATVITANSQWSVEIGLNGVSLTNPYIVVYINNNGHDVPCKYLFTAN